MILDCTFIGIVLTHAEYAINYVLDTIEILETFMNSTLILFGHGLYNKWEVELAKESEGCVEGCKTR